MASASSKSWESVWRPAALPLGSLAIGDRRRLRRTPLPKAHGPEMASASRKPSGCSRAAWRNPADRLPLSLSLLSEQQTEQR